MTELTAARRRILPIAREGWWFVIPFLAFTLIFVILSKPILAVLCVLIAFCVAAFFRDPERHVPRLPGAIVSPADGKVISIQEVEIETEPGRFERLIRVGIFLSIFNVHIQRAPAEGTVVFMKYNPGKFINALNDKASEDNENNMIWLRGPLGTLGVRQIAGIIARRVVNKCHLGQHLASGERVGLIRFGSRTEAYFTPSALVQVRVGQNVKAGLSILAVVPSERNQGRMGEGI